MLSVNEFFGLVRLFDSLFLLLGRFCIGRLGVYFLIGKK